MSTPIQKRLALKRKRSQGIVRLIGAGFFAALTVVDALLGDHSVLLLVFLAVLAVWWLVLGLVSMRQARQQREQLEAEFGRGAGVQ